jgi:hypothetical protein
MSDPVKIGCLVDTTNSSCALGLEIWLDQQKIFDQDHVTDTIQFEHELSDDDCQHQLQFVIKNKLLEHTKISESGHILEDARLIISQVRFDSVLLGYTFNKLAVYSHDFNGTGVVIHDKFFGELGCNGTVTLNFTTPMYLWLLEHM